MQDVRNEESEIKAVVEYPNDVGKWPTRINSEMLKCSGLKKEVRIVSILIKESYPGSHVKYTDKMRVFTKTHFSYIHKPTHVTIDRKWVCYSESSQKVFCFYCKLFSKEVDGPLIRGFNDWKNASRAISSHEKSNKHLISVQNFNTMQTEAGRIDEALVKQYKTETGYWKSVLQRVVAVIKHLSTRGQAFLGQDELIGSVHNGNYLGILELISEFDPFLASHIEKQRTKQQENRGRGSVSYLSSTICEEMIAQMGSQVLTQIVSEIKAAKYFSVSIDSTPDASKVDRISIIIRYLPLSDCGSSSKKAMPKERFLRFIGTNGHSSRELYESLS